MKTHTTKWDKVTMVGISTFVLGLVIAILLGMTDSASFGAGIFVLFSFVGLITTYIGAIKAFGGLITGVTTLFSGLILLLAGIGLENAAETTTVFEITLRNDPKYISGRLLRIFGSALLLPGVITAIITYLRRILHAVENKNPSRN